MKFLLKSILFIFILFILLPAIYLGVKLNQKIDTQGEVIVNIPGNTSLNGVVNILNRNNIFKPSPVFKPFLKLYSVILKEKLYVGTYKFSTENTNYDIVRAIFTGKQRYIVKVTYPEGITLKEFAAITAKNLGIDADDFIEYAKSDSLLKAFKIPAKTPEGYLMPNTYFFYWKEPVANVVNKLLTLHQTNWNEKFRDLAKKSVWTKHEILTLASIVEAESPVATERPAIAGLYLNRLRIGMRLEADPTVKYALGGKKRILYKDLEVESPYNTYRNKGLPPGPINSPSLSSIASVLNPDKNNYLYFVAVGDGSGTHNFARTYSQHLQNKAKYKKNL